LNAQFSIKIYYLKSLKSAIRALVNIFLKIIQQLNKEKKLITHVGSMSYMRERVPMKALISINTVLIGVTINVSI